jgi:hypothetical protein
MLTNMQTAEFDQCYNECCSNTKEIYNLFLTKTGPPPYWPFILLVVIKRMQKTTYVLQSIRKDIWIWEIALYCINEKIPYCPYFGKLLHFFNKQFLTRAKNYYKAAEKDIWIWEIALFVQRITFPNCPYFGNLLLLTI